MERSDSDFRRPSVQAGDQALLESMIEASLAEVAPGARDETSGDGPGADPDGRAEERFLKSAVAFLSGRPDRAALIDRLRALALGPPVAKDAPATAAPAAKSEVDDVPPGD